MTTIETHEQYLAAKQRFHELDQQADASPEELSDLASAILAYEEEVIGVKPAFEVRDLDTLSWYVEKQSDLASKIKRIEAQAAAMIRDVQREIDGLEYRFGHQAERVLRENLTGKKKSLKFLQGTIGLRKTPGRVKFEGDIRDLPLAVAMRDVVITKVDQTKLNREIKVVGDKAYLLETGEEIGFPGLTVTPEGEKVFVKAGQED
ncbi:host-nuclease inhibitor Gam family protein [Deinococcus sp. S9]|uniref:host-nuclease inhibitor Gam family protein n=1 Tax=Deinococcus sp. S9 TaxID=2545754 RepID=UPI0010566FFB|nr:host-nuclease inhibitor Gam family protein [Deinococcus sp. S9]TDE87393.1 hypothetical protein E0686_02555 [Deinococcus sp. S9]